MAHDTTTSSRHAGRSDALILLAGLSGALLGWPHLPPSQGPDAPPGAFSAARALVHIREWSQAPRPTGSEAHAGVVRSVEAELTGLGFEVRREQPGALTNLVASAPGAGPDGVWLVAHSDSVKGAPGAADDGLGLGVVVETARALAGSAGPPPRLHVLITDGEEAGLRGAAAFVRDAPEARRLAINIDARGTEGLAYMFQMAGSTPELLEVWRDSGCAAQATSLAQTVYDLLPNDTDFTVLRRAGWSGYNFALIGGAWRYHSPDDTVENLDPRSVQQVGDCVLGLARGWVDRPDTSPSGPERAYAQVAGMTLSVPTWSVVLFGLLPFGILPRPDRAALLGVVAFVGGVLLTALGGFLLLAAAVAFWPGFREPVAEIPGAEPLYAAAVALGFGGCWVARRFSPTGPASALATLTIAALLACASPGAGYVLIPGAWAAALRLRHTGLAALPALLAGAVLTPLYIGIFPALTSRMLPALALLPMFTLGWLFARRAPPPIPALGARTGP